MKDISRKLLATGMALSTPDAQIIFTKASYIQYKQILLDKNVTQYLETIMVSKKNIENGNPKNTPAENI